jgi:hypothetical protein
VVRPRPWPKHRPSRRRPNASTQAILSVGPEGLGVGARPSRRVIRNKGGVQSEGGWCVVAASASFFSSLFAEPRISWTLAIWGTVKGRVRSSPSVRRGDRSAYPTDYDGTGNGTLCATVFRTCLPACSAACGRCNLGCGKEDGSFRTQSGGSATREALVPLPSGLEPCCVVEPRSKPRTARVAR